jgi:hypothetical protein
MNQLCVLHQGDLKEAFAWFRAASKAKTPPNFYSENSLARALARDTHLFKEVGQDAPEDTDYYTYVEMPSAEQIESWEEQEALIRLYQVRVQFPGLPHEEMKIPPMIWSLPRICSHRLLSLSGEEEKAWKLGQEAPLLPTYSRRLYRALGKDLQEIRSFSTLRKVESFESCLIKPRDLEAAVYEGYFQDQPWRLECGTTLFLYPEGSIRFGDWEYVMTPEEIEQKLAPFFSQREPDNKGLINSIRAVLCALQFSEIDLMLCTSEEWLSYVCWALEESRGTHSAIFIDGEGDHVSRMPLIKKGALFALKDHPDPTQMRTAALESAKQMRIISEFKRAGDYYRYLAKQNAQVSA